MHDFFLHGSCLLKLIFYFIEILWWVWLNVILAETHFQTIDIGTSLSYRCLINAWIWKSWKIEFRESLIWTIFDIYGGFWSKKCPQIPRGVVRINHSIHELIRIGIACSHRVFLPKCSSVVGINFGRDMINVDFLLQYCFRLALSRFLCMRNILGWFLEI